MKKINNEVLIRSGAAEYLTYVSSVGDSRDNIEMRYEDGNIRLTQKLMAALYDVDVSTIIYFLILPIPFYFSITFLFCRILFNFFLLGGGHFFGYKNEACNRQKEK